jgi:hypothetical protein
MNDRTGGIDPTQFHAVAILFERDVSDIPEGVRDFHCAGSQLAIL